MATKSKSLDGKWFRLMIGRKEISLREFCRQIDMDPSAFHRVLTGHRRLQLNEVETIASVLAPLVTVEEVLAHAGLALDEPRGASVRLVDQMPMSPLGGSIDPTGLVVFSGGNPRVDVLALEMTGDPFMEGKYVLYRPGDIARYPDSGLDVGLIKMPDGRVVFRKIKPGFTPGKWDLGPALGFGEREADVEIGGVIPVVGVRF